MAAAFATSHGRFSAFAASRSPSPNWAATTHGGDGAPGGGLSDGGDADWETERPSPARPQPSPAARRRRRADAPAQRGTDGGDTPKSGRRGFAPAPPQPTMRDTEGAGSGGAPPEPPYTPPAQRSVPRDGDSGDERAAATTPSRSAAALGCGAVPARRRPPTPAAARRGGGGAPRGDDASSLGYDDSSGSSVAARQRRADAARRRAPTPHPPLPDSDASDDGGSALSVPATPAATQSSDDEEREWRTRQNTRIAVAESYVQRERIDREFRAFVESGLAQPPEDAPLRTPSSRRVVFARHPVPIHAGYSSDHYSDYHSDRSASPRRRRSLVKDTAPDSPHPARLRR